MHNIRTSVHPTIHTAYSVWESQQGPAEPQVRPGVHPILQWINSLDEDEFERQDKVVDHADDDADCDSDAGGVPLYTPSGPMKLQLRNGDLKDIHIPPMSTSSSTLQTSLSASNISTTWVETNAYLPPAKRAGSVGKPCSEHEKQDLQPERQPTLPKYKSGFHHASQAVRGQETSVKPCGKAQNKGKGRNTSTNRRGVFSRKKERALDQPWR